MGKSSSKTRKFEDGHISKILLLHSGKLALLNLCEIEIISRETLETEKIIPGKNILNDIIKFQTVI